jgi:hypothetical protein
MAVQIPAEIESQIEAFARRSGESKDDLVRKAAASRSNTTSPGYGAIAWAPTESSAKSKTNA